MKSKNSLPLGVLVIILSPSGCHAPDSSAGGAPSWEALLASSAKTFEGRTAYVTAGDMPVSLDELAAEFRRRLGARSGPPTASAEQASTVNTINGQDDLWGRNLSHSLRYCVSTEFGRRKLRVAAEMAQAAAEWENHAWVDFQHVPSADTNCVDGNPDILFAVRPWDQGGACAFFPSGTSCVPRTIVIDYDDIESNYGAVSTVGILRHELGHVLGLRHEHIRAPVPNCGEAGTWRPVTDYDPSSVMHYPWCPGATNTGDLEITAADAAGISQLYPKPTTGDFTDASGTVSVQVIECPWSAVAPHPGATCPVDPDYVLVGGGAEISGEGAPGALLTSSYPNAELTAWVATSKDHLASYAHRVRAYSIGLRLAGVPPATLRDHIVLVSAQSATVPHPSATATVPPGYLLIGGGARASSSGLGQLLTTSRPSGAGWIASSKDHLQSDAGTVTAYAIGITAGPIAGFGSLEALVTSVGAFVSTGYSTSTLATQAGWVSTSIGGEAQYGGAGRLLADLLPYPSAPSNSILGVVARSKDHQAASAGTTTAYLVSVRRQ